MLPPTPSQIGRQKLPVDREKVRMLVSEIGYTEAAKYRNRPRRALSMELSLQMEHFAGGFTLCKKCHHLSANIRNVCTSRRRFG